MSTNSIINTANPIAVASGATGLATLTAHSVQVGAGTSAITQIGVGASGSVLLGATAADPAFALLTSSGGTIAFTTGANSLNLEAATASGSFVWSVITTSQTAAINNGYITNSASLITVTLPATAAVGTLFEIAGIGTGGWQLGQAASQYINFGAHVTTTGTGGYLASTLTNDTVKVVCTVANVGFIVTSAVGNITYN